MKFINQKVGIFFWRQVISCPLTFQKILQGLFFYFFKNPNLKRNIFSKKNIDVAFPNLNEKEKRNLLELVVLKGEGFGFYWSPPRKEFIRVYRNAHVGKRIN